MSGAASLRTALSLWRQYGTASCAYRATYVLARRTGVLKRRFPTPEWGEAEAALATSAKNPWLRQVVERDGDHAPPRFFFAPGSLPRLDPDSAAQAVRSADAVLQGRLVYFGGVEADVGFPFQWLRNPLTGESADAARHWCDRDDFEPGQGDIRVLWEPSRFLWVYSLARGYAASGDERYPEAFFGLVDSWRDANPVNRGPNWQCGQECALRAMALSFGLYAFGASPAASVERRRRLLALLALHGRRIEANLRYARSQKSNHAATEAAGLCTLGLLLPWDRRAPSWLRRGHAVLEEDARRLHMPDGSYVQNSMNYLRMTLHNYLWSGRLLELHGQPLSGTVRERLAAAMEFLYQLQDPAGGRVPNYGPNDGSLILPLDSCDAGDYRPVIETLAAWLKEESYYSEGPWDESRRWLLSGRPATIPLPRERRSRRFDNGGYFVLRGRESWGMIRCHRHTTRPGQADLLHLDAWWNGVNVLRDSGSFSYNSAPWDRHFPGTAAHNTVEVGGVDQMVKGNRFTWTHLAWGRVGRFVPSFGPDIDLFEGEHDGYRRLASGAIHRRAVVRLGERGWLVVDDVLGTGEVPVRLLWHLADGPAVLDGTRAVLSTSAGPVAIVVTADGPPPLVRLARGTLRPSPLGWQSLRYGERTAAPTIEISAGGRLPRRLVSLILLGGGEAVFEGSTCETVRATFVHGGDGFEAALKPPDWRGPIVASAFWLERDRAAGGPPAAASALA